MPLFRVAPEGAEWDAAPLACSQLGQLEVALGLARRALLPVPEPGCSEPTGAQFSASDSPWRCHCLLRSEFLPQHRAQLGACLWGALGSVGPVSLYPHLGSVGTCTVATAMLVTCHLFHVTPSVQRVVGEREPKRTLF